MTEAAIEKTPIDEESISKEKLTKAVKNAHKDVTGKIKSAMETQEKIYNLGFMPLNEVAQLVVDELGEAYNLDRIKKLWLPKSQKVNQIVNSDMQLLDEEKMNAVVRDIDQKHANKLQEIENKIKSNPFWQANKHSIKMVRIDELITLQNAVNIDRANSLAEKISKDATMEDLLDYNFDFNREPPIINSHFISNNAAIFSTDDHDVRPGKIEVRKISKFDGDESNGTAPALVIPVVEGEPSVYCIRTYNFVEMPDKTTKKIYYLTLQNGIHRAYALRSLGIEYMPCLIIDPITAGETHMLMGNWSPERLQQNASQRPPLMRDFFNPELTEKFNVRKRLMCVRVEWKVEKFTT